MEDYKPLSKDWITEGTIDLEYKSYLLLAYLKRVEQKFSNIELYPPLRDLIDQYQSLLSLREGQDEFFEKAQKNPVKVDLEKLKIIYEDLPGGQEWMEEINRILEFSIPRIQSRVETGKAIYEEIENQINLEPVGIIPIDQSQGILFLKTRELGYVDVFQFKIEKMDYQGSPIKGIYTKFLETLKKGFSTLENLKTKLIDRYQWGEVPMAYFINTEYWVPRDSTLMPIAKRKILASVRV